MYIYIKHDNKHDMIIAEIEFVIYLFFFCPLPNTFVGLNIYLKIISGGIQVRTCTIL